MSSQNPIQFKLPTYFKTYGQANVTAEEKEQAARELFAFHYQFLRQNCPDYPLLWREEDFAQVRFLGFVGHPVITGAAKPIEELVKEKLGLTYERPKHISFLCDRGLQGSAQYAVFEIPANKLTQGQGQSDADNIVTD